MRRKLGKGDLAQGLEAKESLKEHRQKRRSQCKTRQDLRKENEINVALF